MLDSQQGAKVQLFGYVQIGIRLKNVKRIHLIILKTSLGKPYYFDFCSKPGRSRVARSFFERFSFHPISPELDSISYFVVCHLSNNQESYNNESRKRNDFCFNYNLFIFENINTE